MDHCFIGILIKKSLNQKQLYHKLLIQIVLYKNSWLDIQIEEYIFWEVLEKLFEILLLEERRFKDKNHTFIVDYPWKLWKIDSKIKIESPTLLEALIEF